jgi:hypothetical protein
MGSSGTLGADGDDAFDLFFLGGIARLFLGRYYDIL